MLLNVFRSLIEEKSKEYVSKSGKSCTAYTVIEQQSPTCGPRTTGGLQKYLGGQRERINGYL